MSAHGKALVLTTYTGGCGTGVVDVNPHVVAKIQALLTVWIELIDGAGQRVAASGVIYENVVFTGTDIDCGRWRQAVPRGGVSVHVYANLNEETVKDTAQCRT